MHLHATRQKYDYIQMNHVPCYEIALIDQITVSMNWNLSKKL